MRGQRPNWRISIHALLAESDFSALNNILKLFPFLSTLSLRRATRSPGFGFCRPGYFYPRSPCGERLEEVSGDTWARDFYPRSPCGERPLLSIQNIRNSGISIHALLAESDSRQHLSSGFWGGYFYPRSPCGERPVSHQSQRQKPPFLSTLSLRRATPCACSDGSVCLFLSTLSLRRATQAQGFKIPAHSISIHALLAESDISQLQCILGRKYFYPRSPCGERPVCLKLLATLLPISIHALLAESDSTAFA